MSLLSFSFSKYIFLPWQKTYCRKRKSPSLGPYRTDRWDAANKDLLENAFLSVCISESSLFQLAGLKAIVQFSAVQRLKCSQAVIQSHFSEMLAGVCMVEPVS